MYALLSKFPPGFYFARLGSWIKSLITQGKHTFIYSLSKLHDQIFANQTIFPSSKGILFIKFHFLNFC
jgi:hypothetical protein